MKIENNPHVLRFGNRLVPYALHRGDRKNMRVVVNPDLSVEVYAPRRTSLRVIEDVMDKKARWIFKTIDKAESYHPLPSPKKYIGGETFMYLGRQYRLKVENGAKNSALLIGRYLRVSVADCRDGEAVKRRVTDWYREHATSAFERYLERNMRIASRHGVPEPTMCLRQMKRRWGSCTASGRITLNINLVQTPVHCIEYVIMHELCHLRHHNHGPAFYRLLTQCQPDWRRRKEALDKFRLC